MQVTMVARGLGGACQHKQVELHETDDGADVRPLSRPVGVGGANLPADVKNVQTLLNEVTPPDGGPPQPLATDGICGPKTQAAIKQFQRRYSPPLLQDGRIDPGRNTWRKLMECTGGPVDTMGAKPAGAISAPSSSVITEDMQVQFATYLFLARHRVIAAIRSIDEAQAQLDVLNMRTFMLPRVNLMQAYAENFNNTPDRVSELIVADRCYKIFQLANGNLNMKLTYGELSSTLRKIRSVYVSMLDVVAANSITTPDDEKTGKRRFLRVVRQVILDIAHPEYGKDGVLADAVLGGWNNRDARIGRIRYGRAHFDKTNAFSTLIHEMAHFVSHQSTFWIGDHGYYHAAFKATPYLAIRNAESYSWFALLASFKHLRPLPDNALPIDV